MTIKVIKIKESFIDKRGKITNILEKPVTSIVIITSKKGAIRANHYHKRDSHWSYIIKGKMKYYEERKSGKVEKVTVKAGEMVYSAPGVPHAMKFLESSIFLAMTTQKRLKGKYDKDTIPHEII